VNGLSSLSRDSLGGIYLMIAPEETSQSLDIKFGKLR
jgi:hypothetical protein